MIPFLSNKNQQFLADLERIDRRANSAQAQVSTGLRIRQGSDSPDEIGQLLQARADLAAANQTKFNLDRVKTEVDSGEGALDSIIKLTERVRTLGAQGGTGTQTAETRNIIAGEVEGIFRQLVAAANTAVDGRFVFSGNNDQVAPFTLDGTEPDGVAPYAGTAATRQVLDANGALIDVARSGADLFQSATPGANVFEAVNALRAALLANDESAIRTAQDGLSGSLEHLNTELAWYGHAQNNVATSLEIVQERTLDLRTRIAETEEADLAQAILEMQTAQTARQAALQAKGQEDRRTVFDFLR